MSQQGELQGFINVKIPSSMKSRNFIPWKTWKRQWVVVRRSRLSRNGVELLIGRNSGSVFQITVDDVICRTESRTQHYAFGVFSPQSKRRANIYLSGTSETDSQKWIYAIRKLLKPPLLPVEEDEFSVAIIDNMFSRSAGFSGLYGTLRIGSEQVTIVDPFTSKNKVEWPWAGLSQFHVSSTIAKEDKGHVCTIVTSRMFPAGIGQIYLYCPRAVELTMKLQVKGKSVSQLSSPPERGFITPYRHHTFSCTCSEKQSVTGPSSIPLSASQAALGKSSPIPRSFLLSRRLSRSEGNLLSVLREMNTGSYGFLGSGNCLNSFTEESYDSEDKTSFDSNEYFMCRGKVAPGIISAGLGLILSTPGGSEADNESLHEYQRLQKGDSDDDLTSLSLTVPTSKMSSPRRESGVSIASGVYEEIEDFSIHLDCSSLDIVTEDAFESPPPLPPRREPSYINIEDTENGNGYINMLPVPPTLSGFLSKSEGNSPLRSPISSARSQTIMSSAEVSCLKSSSWNGSEDSDYLPMLPSCRFSKRDLKADFTAKDSLEEQHYMVMASIKST